MRIRSFCFTSLLIIMAATSLMAAALENGSASSNNAANITNSANITNAVNATLKEAILSNGGSNLSALNDTTLNATALNDSDLKEIGSKNTTFVIGGDAKVRQTNGAGADVSADACINASDGTKENQQSNRTAFKIKGYTRPTRDAKSGAQCSLTAACLSRGVEGTPHGYVTYYD